MRNFLIRVTRPSVTLPDANFAEDLARLQRGREQVNEEIVCFNKSFASLTNGDHHAVQCDDCGGPISRWIRMRQAASDSAFVAHLYVSDTCRAVGEQWTTLLQLSGGFDLVVSRHGADEDLVSLLADVGKVFNSTDVH